MKIKFFTDKSTKAENTEEYLDDIVKDTDIILEKININTQKGKKLAKEWVVTKRSVPFLFFVCNDESRTYYSVNTLKVLQDQMMLKALTKDLNKNDVYSPKKKDESLMEEY